MSLIFEKLVAGRYLRSRKRDGFISVIAAFSFLGIMLGVATLIIVMSVMNGFRAELINRILGLNGHINVYAAGGKLDNYDAMTAKIKQSVDGVLTVMPSIEGQALMTLDGQASGVIVRALSPQDFKEKAILSESLVEISSRKEGYFNDRWVAIGTAMAQRYNLKIGDELSLIAPEGKSSPFGRIPRTGRYMVGSIFDVGMYEYNASFIFMPLDTAQKFFRMKGYVHSLEIMTPDPANLEKTKDDIGYLLRGYVSIADWRDSNASFYTALQVERNVMFLILMLIIIVASFTVIACLIMLVKDKGQDIAIMRTMGATRGMIIRIFLYTGATIGVMGTLTGAFLGIMFANNIESIRRWLEGMTGTELFADEIYFLSQLPAKMDPNEVAGIVIMALLISFAATIYPAWRAAKIDPLEALRYE